MKTIDISAVSRTTIGKRGSKDVRKDGLVPGVIYDNGKAISISVPAKELKGVLYSPETYLVNIDVEGTVHQAVVKESQFHPVTEAMLHVDFLKITEGKEIEVQLPVKLVGTAAGVIKGGKLLTKLRRIRVKGEPAKLPAEIEVNVSSMDLGGNILVKDVKFDVNVTASPTTAIASVEIPRSLKSAMSKG